jgi:hypothetical protein
MSQNPQHTQARKALLIQSRLPPDAGVGLREADLWVSLGHFKNNFLVFLVLPQGSLIVHSFFTIVCRFCIAWSQQFG